MRFSGKRAAKNWSLIQADEKYGSSQQKIIRLEKKIIEKYQVQKESKVRT